MSRRVVITGLGMVSPLGIGTAENWNRLIEGQSGIGLITRFDTTEYTSKIAGEVKNFDPANWIPKKEIKKMDRFIHYAIAASDFAVQDSGLKIDSSNNTRAGVYIGSGIGGFGVIEETHTALMQGGPRKISPFFIPASIVNLASGWVSIRSGAKGPNSATCTACTTGAHAIGDAYKIIQRGAADIMIAGGSEGCITPLGIGGFCAMRALSTRNDEPQKASRPFDRDRDGFVMGEGSGILILEALENARKRNAKIYAEVVGYGMSSDAFHITAPSEDGDGAIRVMQETLLDARVRPEEVDYINAHGTSTPFNDKAETMAIKKVFGEHAKKLAVSSTKSMTGHLLGAAGGLEGAIIALSIHHQMLPPTINLDNPDAECDLDYVPHRSRPATIRYALSNSFGFGGTNGALLFKRFSD
ncbi:MAG: beta-ketoacyl-[acyl-carrier-protein] synthase II [Acidobacteria bacterium]|nr:MAG: beta-ketoacyl-[acyl-carrier-protein] synthase II [Acidobacteriota bacterium]